MSAVSIITSVLSGTARNSDEVARLLATHGDDLVAAIRNGNADAFLRNVNGGTELLGNPAFTRMMARVSDNMTYIDDIGDAMARGVRIDADTFITRLGLSGSDTAAAAITRNIDDLNRVIAEGAEQVGRNENLLAGFVRNSDDVVRAPAAHIDDVAPAAARADDAFRAAARSVDDVAETAARNNNGYRYNLGDMLHTRAGRYTAYTGLGLVGAEYASGGALSSAAAHGLNNIALRLESTDPELAASLHSLAAHFGSTALGIMATPRNGAINAAATGLELRGSEQGATAVRVYGVMGDWPAIAARLYAVDEDQRLDVLIEQFERAGVSREQLEDFLIEHPREASLLQDRTSFNLHEAFPRLAEAQAEVSAPSFAPAAPSGLSNVSLRNSFAQTMDVASELRDSGVNLGWQFTMWQGLNALITALAQLFDSMGFGENFISRCLDEVTENLQHQMADLVYDRASVLTQRNDAHELVAALEQPAPTHVPQGPAPAPF